LRQQFNESYADGESGTEEPDDDKDWKHVPIPLFSRTREVIVNADGTMRYSCYRFECIFFFVQDLKVARLVHNARGDNFRGFTHHDVSVRYLSSYIHLAYKQATPKHTRCSSTNMLITCWDMSPRSIPLVSSRFMRWPTWEIS